MSWINLSSTRHLLLAEIEKDEFSDGEVYDNPRIVVPLLIRCAMIGDVKRLQHNATAIIESYRALETDLSSGTSKVTDLLMLEQALSLSILLDIAGHEDRGMRAWAQNWTASKAEEDQVMLRAIKGLTAGAGQATSPAPSGHIGSWIEWLSVARRAPFASLIDLVTCPDHDLWSTLLFFAAPLAAATAAQSGEPVLSFLQWGAHYKDADRIVYERKQPLPSQGHRGFDAVVDASDGPVGCYNLSMVDRIQFAQDISEILEGSDADWSATGLSGQKLRIYYDPRTDRISNYAVAEAAKTKGREVTLHSFLEGP